jgi:hypothetical protein
LKRWRKKGNWRKRERN